MEGKPLNPFAPPEQDGAVPLDGPSVGYQSQEGLGAGLTWALFALAGLHALTAFCALFDPTTAVRVLVPVALILYIAIAVPFAMFLFRTNRNLRALGEYLRFSPGATIYWYFVPFLNLVRPYQSMAEMWDACRSDSMPRRDVLPVWWALFLLNSFAGRMEPVTDTASPATFVRSVIACGLSICAMIVVQALGAGQEARARAER